MISKEGRRVGKLMGGVVKHDKWGTISPLFSQNAK